ncbi:hypothetical protein ACIQGZ_28035 [Streptomyces sp. NPDC092296]
MHRSYTTHPYDLKPAVHGRQEDDSRYQLAFDEAGEDALTIF